MYSCQGSGPQLTCQGTLSDRVRERHQGRGHNEQNPQRSFMVPLDLCQAGQQEHQLVQRALSLHSMPSLRLIGYACCLYPAASTKHTPCSEGYKIHCCRVLEVLFEGECLTMLCGGSPGT